MKSRISKIVLAIICASTIALSGIALKGCSRDNYDFVVGISSFMQHPSLDEARDGFRSRLTELMEAEGKRVRIIYNNANGDAAMASTINNNLIARRVDLINAIATPSAQSARDVASVTQTPIVFSAITCPVNAGLYGSSANLRHMTGASDQVNVATILTLIRELLNASNGEQITLGYLYSSDENNSVITRNNIRAIASANNITLEARPITGIEGIPNAMLALRNAEVQAIYISRDNRLAANMQNVYNNNPTHIPVITGAVAMAEAGGHIAIGVDFVDNGRIAAQKAFDILMNGTTPNDLGFYIAPDYTLELFIHQTRANAHQINIPPSLKEWDVANVRVI